MSNSEENLSIDDCSRIEHERITFYGNLKKKRPTIFPQKEIPQEVILPEPIPSTSVGLPTSWRCTQNNLEELSPDYVSDMIFMRNCVVNYNSPEPSEQLLSKLPCTTFKVLWKIDENDKTFTQLTGTYKCKNNKYKFIHCEKKDSSDLAGSNNNSNEDRTAHPSHTLESVCISGIDQRRQKQKSNKRWNYKKVHQRRGELLRGIENSPIDFINGAKKLNVVKRQMIKKKRKKSCVLKIKTLTKKQKK